MKNKMVARLLSVVLTAAMLGASFAPAGIYAAETGNQEGELPESDGNVSEEKTDLTEDENVDKTESPKEEVTEKEENLSEVKQDSDSDGSPDVKKTETENEEESVTDDEKEPETQGEENAENTIKFRGDAAGGADSVTFEAGSVTDYDSFISDLKVLEGYAEAFAEENPSENPEELIINFIRTGVQRYTSGTWAILSGSEKTEFTAYVEEQDIENGTEASALRNIEEFTLPNGNIVDMGHVFGTMNVAWYAHSQGMTADVVQARADLGGWAGDTADLMFCAVNIDIQDKVDIYNTTVDEMADAFRERYMGVDSSALNNVGHKFTNTDLYGDLDAFYLFSELARGSSSLSEIAENYFTSSLTDEQRASYFLENRLNKVETRDGIRAAVTAAYTGNELLYSLEASYSLVDLDNHDNLQKAACYAFADYLFELAGDDNGNSGNEPGDDEEEQKPENGYYTVFSKDTTTLAPGVTQDITYALTADDKQIVFYTATVDVSRDDVHVYANYKDNDASEWGMSRVSDQVRAAVIRHTNPEDPDHFISNYTPVVSINADFYNMTTGVPTGALVMEGVQYNGPGKEDFFGILDDGTAVIGKGSEWDQYAGRIMEAVGVNTYLVRDGEIAVSKNENYYKNRASRTCVGLTEDGKVVLMVLDGRQEPFSAGGSFEEIAQIMLEAGCETAVNLDGGGSTTFVAKQEGADHMTTVNRPSDGYERSVSSSLLVVSTAETSTDFDHALISAETDYLTPGSSLNLTATGVSRSGNSADLPEGAEWSVTDETVGTVSDGVFTASGKGEVQVQLSADGEVVGSKTLTVVAPQELELSFASRSIDAIYGEETELPLQATYNENPVTISINDIELSLSNDNAGTINGLTFIGSEDSGIRNVKVTAYIARDISISAVITVALYSDGEARFDFNTAMFGSREFAWNRTVSNSTMEKDFIGDESVNLYYIADPDQPMATNYTFALDMQSVQVPDQLVPLLRMVAGGDLDNVTAWTILLQLAERVSTKTTVTVTLDLDDRFDVDYSNLTFVNDYFELKSTELDKNTNTLTIFVSFVKQSQAIEAETANPIVIVSGISMTPKENAAWDEEDRLMPFNSGVVSYDIYLGASSLYSMSSQTTFQETYGIYPYREPENPAHPSGGHFVSQFMTLTDTYILDKTVRNGWDYSDNDLYYYENGTVLTGIHKLPGYQDEQREYYYDLGEDGIYTGKLTGVFELDGASYYAINGELKSGWWPVTDKNGQTTYYYFGEDKKGLEGRSAKFFDGVVYEFSGGRLLHGVWHTTAGGTRYYYGPGYPQAEWYTVDGSDYYFDNNGYRYEGIRYVKEGNNHDDRIYWYDFGDDGACRGIYEYTGLYTADNNTYYIDNGAAVTGLVLAEDGYYYYFSTSTLTAVKNRSYWVSNPNDTGISPAFYDFDENGHMVIEQEEPDDPENPELLNGIVNEDGTLYYYVDGVRTYAGLIQIDGDYYYVNSSCKVVTSQRYWVSLTNGLLPATFYDFDEDGKIIFEEPEDLLNGIVEEDGALYYYVDGVRTYAGLIQIDGDYYYVNSSCKVVTSQRYWVSLTNGLLPATFYDFDEDGKIIFEEPEDLLNGIVEEDGALYYYVDGVRTYAGLIQIDGDYYYVNSSCRVITGQRYWVSLTNGLLPATFYDFDEEGKIIFETEDKLNGIVEEDGALYYYVDGVRTYAGLIQIDSDYYYVNSSCRVITGQRYWISLTNGLLPATFYDFGEDGKMILE